MSYVRKVFNLLSNNVKKLGELVFFQNFLLVLTYVPFEFVTMVTYRMHQRDVIYSQTCHMLTKPVKKFTVAKLM